MQGTYAAARGLGWQRNKKCAPNKRLIVRCVTKKTVGTYLGLHRRHDVRHPEQLEQFHHLEREPAVQTKGTKYNCMTFT